MVLVLIHANRAGTVECGDEVTAAVAVVDFEASSAAATAAGQRLRFLPLFLRFFSFLVSSWLATISLMCASIEACSTP